MLTGEDCIEDKNVNRYAHYQGLACLFEYPLAGYASKVDQAIQVIERVCPDAVDDIRRFRELLPVEDLRAMQELFMRSFDVQAITTLDLGYVLFGDDYKRGELLSNLNREHREAGNECGSELADHLPNVLRLLPRLEDPELIEELIQEIVAPALSEMIGEFTHERIDKKNKAYRKHYKTLIETPSLPERLAAEQREATTLYQFPLRALYATLKRDFSIIERIPLAATSDFLESLNSENEIEEKAGAFY
jgi:nitrate reductase assembly molybdenum cofactor insertion protein NarJ